MSMLRSRRDRIRQTLANAADAELRLWLALAVQAQTDQALSPLRRAAAADEAAVCRALLAQRAAAPRVRSRRPRADAPAEAGHDERRSRPDAGPSLAGPSLFGQLAPISGGCGKATRTDRLRPAPR